MIVLLAWLPCWHHRRVPPPEDPVLVVARRAAAGLHVLCLDELHVTDVADAMLLSRLFGEVIRQGCMVVFTSNRRVEDAEQLLCERLVLLLTAGHEPSARQVCVGDRQCECAYGLCLDQQGIGLAACTVCFGCSAF